MQQINKPKPDIRVYINGQIDFLSKASKKLGISKDSKISFFTDNEDNLYVKKVKDDGLAPTSLHGANFLRFHSADVARKILSLPDIPKGIVHAGFKLGMPDDGESFPIITRRVL